MHDMERLSQKTLLLGYAAFVFASIMSLSSWNLFYSKSINFTATMLTVMLVALAIISLLSDWTVKRIVVLLIFGTLLLIYFYLFKLTYMLPILLALIVGTGLDFKSILKYDFFSRLFSVLFVVILSLFSILPKSGYGADISDFYFTIFCYGFTYTNILAFEIGVLFIESLLVLKVREIYRVLLMLLITWLEIKMGYETGAVFCLVGYTIFATTKKRSTRIPNLYLMMSAWLVPFFSFLSIYVASNFSSTDDFWNRVNDLLSGRAEIWQYYYQAMPIKLLGNLQTINQKTMGVVGFGAFDGAFIQFLLTFGVASIFLIFCLFILTSTKKGHLSDKRILSIIILPIVLSGFTETNGFLVTFSPLYFMVSSYLFSVNKLGLKPVTDSRQESLEEVN